MRWPLLGNEQLGDAGIRLADHAHLAVGPRLTGDPLDDVVAIGRLDGLEEVPDAARASGAAQAYADEGVALGYVLGDVAGIGVRPGVVPVVGEQRGEGTGTLRPDD